MIIEVNHLSKKINGKEIIHDLSFHLKRGRILALLGPNGAGKTTIIRLILGLLKPSSGIVRLFDTPICSNKMHILRRNIGVQNEGNLYENLTILQNLDLWGEIYGIESITRRKQINNILRFFNLESRINSKVSELSKGMKQKISIARALIHDPKLLILDEPTSNLDPESTKQLIEYLTKLVRKSGTTVVMCTHQLCGLEETADDTGIIKNGKLNLFENTEDIINDNFPENIYEIRVSPKNKAITLCQKFGKVEDVIFKNDTIKLINKEKTSISEIVKNLVENDIQVSEFFKIKHTIKEVYFKIIGYKNND